MPDDSAGDDTPEPDPAPEPTPDAGIVQVGRPSQGRSSGPSVRQVMLFLALATVIVLQITILQRLSTATEDVDATRAALTGLELDVDAVDARIDGLAAQLDVLEQVPAAGPSSGQSNPISVAPGALPPFTDPQTDLAVRDEYVLGDLTAEEYYAATETTIAPADGTARVWLVWAHWCPYCQQELPELAQWWPENADRFPSTEFLTVTTSVDETRGNPLTPYLDASQFPFPVLMDDDLTIATQFGTSAFPFWVVTDGSGTVIFRVAGAIGIDAIEAIFVQLEAIATGA